MNQSWVWKGNKMMLQAPDECKPGDRRKVDPGMMLVIVLAGTFLA
jgi:hypothetical protein